MELYTEYNLQIGGINFTYVDESPTETGVLKVLAKIFDHLRLITPVTFFGKVFLQDLWKRVYHGMNLYQTSWVINGRRFCTS